MATLAANWLTQGLIDFEYKKYILLDYLQKVQKYFSMQRIYPILSQLVAHYKNLLSLSETKNLLQAQFPKHVIDIDLQRLQLLYQQDPLVDKNMEEIEHILTYAISKIRTTIEIGKEIHEKVESDLEVFPVGLRSLHKQEGYLLLEIQGSGEVKIFRYKLNTLYQSKERYVGIHLRYLAKEKKIQLPALSS